MFLHFLHCSLIEREASAFDRELVRALIEEHANRIEERIRGLRDTLLDAPGEIIAFYKMTDLLTRRMTAENAATGRAKEMTLDQLAIRSGVRS